VTFQVGKPPNTQKESNFLSYMGKLTQNKPASTKKGLLQIC
jgi:hypothetical protein